MLFLYTVQSHIMFCLHIKLFNITCHLNGSIISDISWTTSYSCLLLLESVEKYVLFCKCRSTYFISCSNAKQHIQQYKGACSFFFFINTVALFTSSYLMNSYYILQIISYFVQRFLLHYFLNHWVVQSFPTNLYFLINLLT